MSRGRAARRPRLYLAAALGSFVLIAALVAAAVHGLMDTFQYRIGDPDRDRETLIHLRIDARYTEPTDTDVQAVWTGCVSALTDEQRETGRWTHDSGHVEIVVHPALTEHQRARLGGCLRDLTVYHVKTSDVSLTERPVTPVLREF